MRDKITAVVLAGGSGSRMGSPLKKQYMELDGKPLLFYALHAFQKSFVDEIVLVTNEERYCKKEITEKYGFNKVRKIVPGGKERFDSVYAGLLAADDCDYVMIHDGARPFLTQEMIKVSIEAVKKYNACAAGMPVKDTMKLADGDDFAEKTLERKKVWQIQTPQTFSYPLILQAYQKVLRERPDGITDDAMTIEYGHYAKVKLVSGSYENIKITTPEDMAIAEVFLRRKKERGSD